MSRVLFYSPGPDTAGLGIGMKRAFDAFGGDWTARAIRQSNTYLDYPADLQVERPWRSRLCLQLFDAADVVHVFEHPDAVRQFPGWRTKRIVVHHLGTVYRRNPSGVSAACRAIKATEVADMHDLLRFNTGLGWLPDVIDDVPLAELRAREYRPDPAGRVRIAHAPTSRTIKSTEVIIAAIERLARRLPIDFDLIERVPNAECLARKARADIFVDELTMGYGLNALEAWSMGIPDVSANIVTRDLMVRDFGEPMPFVEATPATLEAVLERLVTDPVERANWGEIGRRHVERFHTQEAIVRQCLELYERVRARRAA